MSAIRQDAWTEQDDQILADVTLRHIKDGGTQLSAFAEVGQKIGRTQAACGFRWNSFLRKQHEQEVRQAKLQRQRLQIDKRKLSTHGIAPSAERNALRLSDGSFAKLASQVQEWLHDLQQLEAKLSISTVELERLRKENEEYRTILQMLDRARSMNV